MIAMRKQAERHGAEVIEENFTNGDFSKSGGTFKVTAGNNTYETKSVIIATGADTKWLDVKGEKEKCFQSGMDDYLTKPLDYDVFCTILKKYK